MPNSERIEKNVAARWNPTLEALTTGEYLIPILDPEGDPLDSEDKIERQARRGEAAQECGNKPPSIVVFPDTELQERERQRAPKHIVFLLPANSREQEKVNGFTLDTGSTVELYYARGIKVANTSDGKTESILAQSIQGTLQFHRNRLVLENAFYCDGKREKPLEGEVRSVEFAVPVDAVVSTIVDDSPKIVYDGRAPANVDESVLPVVPVAK